MTSSAGPIPQEALYNALSREQQNQKMAGRDSEDKLLDEEGIAMNNLSHQRSGVNNTDALPNVSARFQSSTNVAQRGWRRGTSRDLASRDGGANVLALGRLYQRMGKMSIIPRYFFYIVPLAALIAVPLVVGACIPKLELGVPHNSVLRKSIDGLGCPNTLDILVG